MNWYFAALKKYAVFSGRAGRKEFWYFNLFSLIIEILTGLLENGSLESSIEEGVIFWLVVLFHLLPSISVAVRRLHDRDFSGWYMLISLVTGPLFYLFYCTQEGDKGTNRFGPNPEYTSNTATNDVIVGQVYASDSSDAIYCSKCGNKFGERDIFCSNCGANRVETTSVQVRQKVLNEQLPLVEYNAAEARGVNPSNGSTTYPKKTKNNKSSIHWFTWIIAIGVLGRIIYWIYNYFLNLPEGSGGELVVISFFVLFFLFKLFIFVGVCYFIYLVVGKIIRWAKSD